MLPAAVCTPVVPSSAKLSHTGFVTLGVSDGALQEAKRSLSEHKRWSLLSSGQRLGRSQSVQLECFPGQAQQRDSESYKTPLTLHVAVVEAYSRLTQETYLEKVSAEQEVRASQKPSHTVNIKRDATPGSTPCALVTAVAASSSVGVPHRCQQTEGTVWNSEVRERMLYPKRGYAHHRRVLPTLAGRHVDSTEHAYLRTDSYSLHAYS